MGGAVSTYGAVFETANGENILTHYNPVCKDLSTATYIQSFNFEPIAMACANFIYDLNGKKGPNTIGKDMGYMTLLYPSDSQLVAPNMHSQMAKASATYNEAITICRNLDNSRLPTMHEMSAVTINKVLMGYDADLSWSNALWTSTTYEDNSSQARALHPYNDWIIPLNKTSTAGVHCMYRD